MSKTRREVPMYAVRDGATVTKQQFLKCCKGGPGRRAVLDSYNQSVDIAHTKDGKWWVCIKGDVVFWAQRWYQIPATAGERTKKIEEFVQSL